MGYVLAPPLSVFLGRSFDANTSGFFSKQTPTICTAAKEKEEVLVKTPAPSGPTTTPTPAAPHVSPSPLSRPLSGALTHPHNLVSLASRRSPSQPSPPNPPPAPTPFPLRPPADSPSTPPTLAAGRSRRLTRTTTGTGTATTRGVRSRTAGRRDRGLDDSVCMLRRREPHQASCEGRGSTP